MTVKRSGMAILALATSLGVLTTLSQAQKQPGPKPTATAASASAQTASADYQSAIAQMRSAKAYLEKAGDHWGGHRVHAIESIDKAFQALGVSTESTPNELQSGNTDEPTMMNNGISGLHAARSEIAKSTNALGGRKAQALSHIDQALQELQKGVAWAQQNKTY